MVNKNLPLKSPRNLLQTNLRSGRIFIFNSSLLSRIPNSSSTIGKLESTSPTTLGKKLSIN